VKSFRHFSESNRISVWFSRSTDCGNKVEFSRVSGQKPRLLLLLIKNHNLVVIF